MINRWSQDVDTKWKPSEGLFESGSAKQIAEEEFKGHKDLKSAMASINFYLNRGGDNINEDRRKIIEKAKELLRNKYNKNFSDKKVKITYRDEDGEDSSEFDNDKEADDWEKIMEDRSRYGEKFRIISREYIDKNFSIELPYNLVDCDIMFDVKFDASKELSKYKKLRDSIINKCEKFHSFNECIANEYYLVKFRNSIDPDTIYIVKYTGDVSDPIDSYDYYIQDSILEELRDKPKLINEHVEWIIQPDSNSLIKLFELNKSTVINILKNIDKDSPLLLNSNKLLYTIDIVFNLYDIDMEIFSDIVFIKSGFIYDSKLIYTSYLCDLNKVYSYIKSNFKNGILKMNNFSERLMRVHDIFNFALDDSDVKKFNSMRDKVFKKFKKYKEFSELIPGEWYAVKFTPDQSTEYDLVLFKYTGDKNYPIDVDKTRYFMESCIDTGKHSYEDMLNSIEYVIKPDYKSLTEYLKISKDETEFALNKTGEDYEGYLFFPSEHGFKMELDKPYNLVTCNFGIDFNQFSKKVKAVAFLYEGDDYGIAYYIINDPNNEIDKFLKNNF